MQLKEPYYLRKEWEKILFEKAPLGKDGSPLREDQFIDIPPYIGDPRTPIQQVCVTVLDLKKEKIPISIRFKKGSLSNGDYTTQLKVPEKWKGKYGENEIMGFVGNIMKLYFRKNGIDTI